MDLNDKIGFIGAGNMAEALVRGMIAAGLNPSQIILSDANKERCEQLAKMFAVGVAEDNTHIVQQCRIIVLATKPQVMREVLAPLKDEVTDHLLVSILAGTSTADLESCFSAKVRVIRSMPNTPALVGVGATAICRGHNASAEDLTIARTLFSGSGQVHEVTESQMDAVTGLSGSGPAYVFAVIEALADGGVAEGLTRDVALALATQTVLGAATLVRETSEHPAVLKDKVCSPGGTTIAGIKALEGGGLRATLMAAVTAATERSKELGQG